MKKTETRHKEKAKDDAARAARLHAELEALDADIKGREQEFARFMSEHQIRLKFLEAKLEFQQRSNADELKILNKKLKEYKLQIKAMTEQVAVVDATLDSAQMQNYKDTEKSLREQIKQVCCFLFCKRFSFCAITF